MINRVPNRGGPTLLGPRRWLGVKRWVAAIDQQRCAAVL